MSEIKKLGFSLMRLPQRSADGADIDMEQFKKMVDPPTILPLKRAITPKRTQFENSFQSYMN